MADLRLDDDSVYVMFFRSSKSLVIEMITDDQESIDLTHMALLQWFRNKGLSEVDS